MRALLVAALVVAAGSADAHKAYSLKEGVECVECHVNPQGGGPRTLIGSYYQAKHELPLDRSPAGMKLVRDTVDRWMQKVLATPPVIRWSHTPVADLPEEPAPPLTRASDPALLRRLSLDLRGTMPTPEELARLEEGTLTVDGAVDEMMRSPDFQSTFRLYHEDLIRPRTGDYNTPASLTRVATAVIDGELVYSSVRVPGEAGSGGCRAGERVRVSPWWDRKGAHWACKTTGDERVVLDDGTRCDTLPGQKSGKCGCGPHMVFCYPKGVKDRVIDSMKEEAARLAMEVVDTDQPYPTLLTADWTMEDGALEVFYAKLEGRLAELRDPDIDKPWRRLMRPPRHSGVLSTPEMFNFFYNGRRWAQRVFEAFFCHDVYPDFNLLDDTADAGKTTAVPYRDNPDFEPTLTVTESRACAACHMQLDGLSRVKDRWDPFGRYHEVDKRGLPIPQRAIFMGREIDGVDGLGKALAGNDVYADCALNQLWEHMLGHRFTPTEKRTRMTLLDEWKASGLRFKDAIRLVTKTPEYRAGTSLKLMTRELYARSVQRATGVTWKVDGDVGWDVYYDKLGGMDYRKVEERDRSPGQGHSLAQMKGAAETCDEAVKDGGALVVAGSVDDMPTDAQLDQNLQNLYLRAFARPWGDVPDDEKKLMRSLFRSVADKRSPAAGYRAVCTAVFGSEDFALF